MSTDELDALPDGARSLFPDRTTDEVVAEIVAHDPAKHGVTLAERLKRARQAAEYYDDSAEIEEAIIRSHGGDPYEFMAGGRPRWTVGEYGKVHDHLTGATYSHENKERENATPGNESGRKEVATVGARNQMVEEANRGDGLSRDTAISVQPDHHRDCDHDFGEDPQDTTPCVKCSITFEDWANL